jgi:hypothetical protein
VNRALRQNSAYGNGLFDLSDNNPPGGNDGNSILGRSNPDGPAALR